MRKLALFTALLTAGTMLAGTAQAQRHGGWGGGFGGPYDRPFPSDSWRSNKPAGPAEGKVEVTRFVAEDIAPGTLAKGTISVGGAPAGGGIDDRESLAQIFSGLRPSTTEGQRNVVSNDTGCARNVLGGGCDEQAVFGVWSTHPSSIPAEWRYGLWI